MTWRFSISTDGGTAWTVVSPLNGSKLKVEQSRDLDAGQVFFRKKLTGKPMLGGDDFKLIDAVRRNPTRRCEELLIKCERDCGQWQEYWRGGFTAAGGTWDLQGCTVELIPKTLDRYTCLLEMGDVKRNILNTPSVSVDVVVFPPNIEIWATTQTVGPGATPLSAWGWDQVDTQVMTFVNIGTCGGVIVGGSPTVNIYWRQRIDVDCINGASNPPPGTGWFALSTDVSETGDGGIGSAPTCAADGRGRYVRIPTVAWPFPNDPLVQGPVVSYSPQGAPLSDIVFEEPASPACDQWYRVGNRRGFCEAIGLYVCLDDAIPVTIDNAHTLHGVMEYLAGLMGCEDIAGIRSDLFEWNAPGDAPGYSPGMNFVTGLANTINNLLILQKTDVILPNASNPATIGDMSFNEAMSALRVMTRILWDIDDEGYIRIEHYSYWGSQQSIDLIALAANEPLIYGSQTGRIPRIERAAFMESLGRDFVGLDLVYSSPCVNADEPLGWSPGKITTDMAFILTDPDEISKDGFVLVAAHLNSGTYSAIIGQGAITNSVITNAPLSWANLQRDFWTWDRFLPSANMNGADTDFPNFLPTVQQEGVSFRACCSLLAFDPRRRINGALARRLGVLGVVETVSHDLYTDRITLVLRYPY